MFFCKERSEILKQQDPNLKRPQVLVEVGRLWKTLSDSEKQRFQILAAKDKERYEKEKKVYEANKKL